MQVAKSVNRVLVLISILSFAATSPYAQTADSLDARGYFPLAVGNAWEYEHDMYRPLTADTNRTHYERYEITGYDIVGDTTFFELVAVARGEDGSLVGRDTSRLWYDATSASIRGGNLPQIIDWLKCLDAPFDAPIEDPPEGCWLFVDRDEAYVFDSTYAAKGFSSYVWGFAVVHGIGLTRGGGGCEPCSAFDDHDNWWLRYAKVGTREYGARIVQVERPRISLGSELAVYPNPTGGVVTIEVPDPGTLSIYDLLGRRLREVEVGSTEQQRVDLGTFSPGLYILRFDETTRAVVIQ